MKKLINIVLIAAYIMSLCTFAYADTQITAKVGIPNPLAAGDFTLDAADKIVITELPVYGVLTIGVTSIKVPENEEIAVGDINSFVYTAHTLGTDIIKYNVYKEGVLLNESVRKLQIIVGPPTRPTVGNITKNITDIVTVPFVSTDFTSKYTANDGGALASITITELPSYGSLYLSGSPKSVLNVGAVIPVEGIDGLIYSPEAIIADEGKTGSDSFKYLATGENNNLTSSTEATVTINIDRTVSTTPSVSDTAVSTSKNVTYTFARTDFSNKYSDSSAMAEIQIVTLPDSKAGKLLLNTTAVTAGQKISASNIPNLTFVPVTGYIGSTSFGWKASNGVNYSATSALCTVSITSQLTAGSFSKSMNKSSTLTFTQKDFTDNFTGTTTGASLYDIQITGLPDSAYGTLYNGSTVVSRNDVIVSKNLGSLKFTSTAKAGTVTFTYRVRESSSGGYSSNGTVTISIGYSLTPENFSKNVSSGGELNFTQDDFEEHCSLSSASARLAYVKIVTLPRATDGTLYLNNSAISAGTNIPVGQLRNITFVPKSGSSTASFTYKISDSTADTTYSGGTATVTIYTGNAAPTVSNFSITVSNRSTYTFSKALFEDNYSDKDNDSIGSIKISSLPSSSAGTLRYDGTAVTEGVEIAVANISRLTFVPVSDYTGSASFNWCASDGKVFSSTARCSITVSNRDVTPTLSNGTVTTIQNKTYSFSQGDFTALFRQADDRSLSYITVTALPNSSAGALYLNSKAVTKGQEISRSNLSSFSFVPTKDYVGTASFTFTASDGSNTSAAATMSISVLPTSVESTTAPVITVFRVESELVSTRTVRLIISAYDSAYGMPSQMAFSVNGGTFSSWVSYQSAYDYTLPSSEGFYTIRIKVRNASNKESAVQSLTVRFDRSQPEIICAAISGDRKTVTVVYSKSITTNHSNSALRSYIRFGSSGSTRQNLSSNDSVTIDGASITVSLSSALSSSYDMVYIAKDAICDLYGTSVDTDAQASLKTSASYYLDRRSQTVVLEETRPSSGKISKIVDSISMRSIMSEIDYTNGTLVFELPAQSGTATTRELTLPGDVLLSSANRRKIAEIGLTDGNATLYVKTDWLYNSMLDATAPITLVLTSNSSPRDVNLSDVGASYTVSIYCGGFEMLSYGERSVVLSIPYAANDPETAVMLTGSGSARSPLYSSRFAEGVVDSRIKGGGTYFTAQNSLTFFDVPSDHWAFHYIRGLSAKGIIDGMGNGRFEPDGKLTRAQFIKVLVTSLDLMRDGAICGFTDVTVSDWYYSYISSAVSAGIITQSSGRFNPDEPITREDMCVFAYLAATPAGFTYPTNSAAINFTDAHLINSNAQRAISALTRAGVVNGYTDGSFQPYGTSARSEVSKLMELIIALQY